MKTDSSPFDPSASSEDVQAPTCVLPDGSIDHEWEFTDDSFDHEFGTERIHYWTCTHCGETRGMGPGDYDDDDGYF